MKAIKMERTAAMLNGFLVRIFVIMKCYNASHNDNDEILCVLCANAWYRHTDTHTHNQKPHHPKIFTRVIHTVSISQQRVFGLIRCCAALLLNRFD